MPTPKTFEEFYAPISAPRKAEIAACTDPVMRAAHEAWEQHFEAKYRRLWQAEQERKERFQSVARDEEWEERRGPVKRREHGPSGDEQHATYVVDRNGKAW